jgi:16S rRNA (uracil1498-N3)-methyltransferase
MPAYDFASPRLFVDRDLAPGLDCALDKPQQNYLGNVLRLKAGDRVLVFNGRDGEFEARLSGEGKRLALVLSGRTRPQTLKPSLRFLFAPLKHARLDYAVQKAVEMGVGSLEPVITRRTQVTRVNLARMEGNVIEAAEQCGILSLPDILPDRPLMAALDSLGPETHLVFCDERAEVSDPVAALAGGPERPLAVLIGPEGGFDEAERSALGARPLVTRLALGPRILRADTAAVAALALVQAARGDWRG